jgi:hypothetical protein
MTGRALPSAPSWWRANRTAIALLAPMLALTIASSSFRSVSIYRPSTLSAGQVSSGSTVHFSATSRHAPVEVHRDVTVTLDSAVPRTIVDELRAAPGTTLWEVTLTLAADPTVPLTGCTVELLDATGRVFGTQGGKPAPARGSDRTAYPECTPSETPGPLVEIDGRVTAPSGPQRPPSWPVRVVVAMPTGVPPTHVRIHWGPPDYAQVSLA